MQPDHTEIFIWANEKRYTPDAEIITPDIKHLVIEIKYEEEANTLKNTEKFKSIYETYKEYDERYEFRVVTEREIHVGHRVQNIRQLHSSTLHDAPTELFNEFISGLKYGQLTIQQAIQLANEKKLPNWFIKRGIAHKLFS